MEQIYHQTQKEFLKGKSKTQYDDVVHWRILHHQTWMCQVNQPTHNDNEAPLECASIPEIYQDA